MSGVLYPTPLILLGPNTTIKTSLLFTKVSFVRQQTATQFGIMSLMRTEGEQARKNLKMDGYFILPPGLPILPTRIYGIDVSNMILTLDGESFTLPCFVSIYPSFVASPVPAINF